MRTEPTFSPSRTLTSTGDAGWFPGEVLSLSPPSAVLDHVPLSLFDCRGTPPSPLSWSVQRRYRVVSQGERDGNLIVTTRQRCR